MLLHTFPYLVFLLVIGLITWQLPRISQRKYLWLAASYVFYSAFDIRFSILLAMLTVCVYIIGRQISHGPQAKFYLILSIIINLSVLGIFKYLNFFLDNVSIGIFGLRRGYFLTWVTPDTADWNIFLHLPGDLLHERVISKKDQDSHSILGFCPVYGIFP